MSLTPGPEMRRKNVVIESLIFGLVAGIYCGIVFQEAVRVWMQPPKRRKHTLWEDTQ